MSAAPVIAVEGLEKRFRPGAGNRLTGRGLRELRAVDGVSLEIAPGEALGLVGESGCGKTTLARMISRLTAPDAGRIWLTGEDVTDMPARAFHRMAAVQMVFQDPGESLDPRRRVFDLIGDPLRRLRPPENRAALRAAVEAAMRAVDLPPEFLSRLPHQLSAGQQARVGIARAMAVGPPLLVLDEPTSALDVSVQVTVLKLLDRLRREEGVALLFISHDLNLVRLLCDRVAVMQQGRIVEAGAAQAVFDAPEHPCTQALIAALPSLDAAGRTAR